MSGEQLPALLQQLLSRLGRGAKLGLRGVRQALAQLGNPHEDLEVVHVAGTNGKGSVCAMVEAIARASGLRTGLYTSPHLCRYHERIRLDGAPIDDEHLARALAPVLDDALPPLTFFETMTVAAFVAMRDAGVELAVLEVGLGGRLDATNIVDRPLATAVTSIGVDHTRYLGTDLAMIAAEKAAIAKPGCPLVIGPTSRRAAQAIERVAVRAGATPVWVVNPGHHRHPGGAPTPAPHRPAPAATSVAVTALADGRVHLRGPAGQEARARLGLAGPHQIDNAAVAATIGWLLEPRWPQIGAAVRGGLEAAEWPGRLETIERDGVRIVLDGAHNPDAAEAVLAAIGRGHDPACTALIFGAMGDKSWRPMLEKLAPLTQRRYYTEPLRPIANRRSVPVATLVDFARGEGIEDPRAALARALQDAATGDTILVTGSIFLVGAVRAALLGLQQDEIVPL